MGQQCATCFFNIKESETRTHTNKRSGTLIASTQLNTPYTSSDSANNPDELRNSNLLTDLMKSSSLQKDVHDPYTTTSAKLSQFEVIKVIGRGGYAKIY